MASSVGELLYVFARRHRVGDLMEVGVVAESDWEWDSAEPRSPAQGLITEPRAVPEAPWGALQTSECAGAAGAPASYWHLRTLRDGSAF